MIALFLIVGPIHRIDAGEFAVKLSPYDARPFVDWTADDDAGLKGLVKDYGARGVDTAAGQDLLDRRASFVAAARAVCSRSRPEAGGASGEAEGRSGQEGGAALAAKRLAAKNWPKKRRRRKKKKAAASH